MTYKTLKRLFKKPSKRIIKLSSRELESNQNQAGRSSSSLERPERDENQEKRRVSDDSFDDKIYKKQNGNDPEGGLENQVGSGTRTSFSASRRPLPTPPVVQEPFTNDYLPLQTDLNSLGIYSTSGQTSMVSPSNDDSGDHQNSVPLIKMKSYEEFETEMKRRDSNLSLNEKIALRVMAKSPVFYEEPLETVPEGISTQVCEANESSCASDEADMDSEMAAFIKPIESILVKGHGKFSGPQIKSDTRDELSDMIKEVDVFISGFSSTKENENGDQGNFKAGSWAARHSAAKPYSNVNESIRLQQRLKERVMARNLTPSISSQESLPSKCIVSPLAPLKRLEDGEVKVTGLKESKSTLIHSKSSSLDSLSPHSEIQMSSIQSLQVTKKSYHPTPIPIEEEDPVQTLFLYISQLDTSNVDPLILDYLVKAVGAFARELGSNRIDAACQHEVFYSVTDFGAQSEFEKEILFVDQSSQWDVEMISSKIDFGCQVGQGSWAVHDVDVQTNQVLGLEKSSQVEIECSTEECQSDYSSFVTTNHVECQYDLKREFSTNTINISRQHEEIVTSKEKKRAFLFFKTDEKEQTGQQQELIHSETQYELEDQVKREKMINKPSTSLLGKSSTTLPRLKRSMNNASSGILSSVKYFAEIERHKDEKSSLSGYDHLEIPVAVIGESESKTTSDSGSIKNDIDQENRSFNSILVESSLTPDLGLLESRHDKEDNGTIVDIEVEQGETSSFSNDFIETADDEKLAKRMKGVGISMKSSFSNISRMFAYQKK